MEKGVWSLMDAFTKGKIRSMLLFNVNTAVGPEESQAGILKKNYFILPCDFPLLSQIPLFAQE